MFFFQDHHCLPHGAPVACSFLEPNRKGIQPVSSQPHILSRPHATHRPAPPVRWSRRRGFGLIILAALAFWLLIAAGVKAML